MKVLKFILVFLSAGVFAQSKSGIDRLLVFSPDENSIEFNEVYTKNFFFGNFGIKPLVNSVPVEDKNIRTVRISAETEGKITPDVMVMNYDKEGKLTSMQISEMLSGKAVEVSYVYKEGLITEEIFKDAQGKRSNKFHYAEGKMIVENIKGMIDVYQLKNKILYKQVYLDGKPVFKDRIEGKCRITSYSQEDIDKTCYSNFIENFPMTLEEYSTSENVKTGKASLIPERKWEIKKLDERNYSIFNGPAEQYRLELDGDSNVKNFEFMGIKSEMKKPVHFSFTYTYY